MERHMETRLGSVETAMNNMQSRKEGAKEFVLSRVFAAPRERVWQALTDAERMKEWWGPTGFRVFAAKMDLRPGGVFHCGMRSLEGYKLWGKFVYQDVEAQQRLVFVNAFSNEAGEVVRHPVIPSWPLETLTALIFEDEPDGKTKLTVRWSAPNATEAERKIFDASHVPMRVTWANAFDQLAAYLAKG